MTGTSATIVACLLVPMMGLSGCSRGADARTDETAPAEPRTGPAEERPRGPRSAEPAEVESGPLERADSVLPAGEAPAAKGCAPIDLESVRVLAGGPPAIGIRRNRFLVAGYVSGDAGSEEIAVVELAPGTDPRRVGTFPLEHRLSTGRWAPPALAVKGDEVLVGAVDGRGRVLVGDLSSRTVAGELDLVASGADPRFAPPVAFLGQRRAVVWTDGSGTPMRIRMAYLAPDGAVAERVEFTSAQLGGSAPIFSDYAGNTALFFVEARAGISPIRRVIFDASGTPGPPDVVRPVGTMAAPPQIAVAQAGELPFAAYTAVGNLARTAVGLVELSGDDARPDPLVPGKGYGPLNVSAISGPRRAIFAADVPKDIPPEAPREVHVRLVDGEGMGPPLTVHGPNETASHAVLARRSDGIVAVAFISQRATYVRWLRCDD